MSLINYYICQRHLLYRLYFENNGTTNLWWNKYNKLKENEIIEINKIIEQNDFSDITKYKVNDSIMEVLRFYTIKRTDAVL